MKIRRTEPDDLEQILPLYDHSRNIMRTNGNHSQWIGGYPSPALLARDIERGESYRIDDERGLAGVFAFIIGEEPTYTTIEGGRWRDSDRPYGTIHRIACAPGRHGIFRACVDWCRRQIPSLRIDTHADNAIMRHLIEKERFEYCGIVHIADGSERMAYQMTDSRLLCEPLVRHVEEEILPRYATFDAAHRRDHAERVVGNSLALANHYPVEINMVYAIAAYHDLGLSESRERHHIVSGEMLLADARLRKWFGAEQLATMAEAVEDHRASSGREPRSIYGKIVAEADRDIDPLRIIRRTVQYGADNYPAMDKEEHWRRTVSHLEEKYAAGGYLKLWIPESDNSKALNTLRQIIGDKERLRAIFEEEYEATMTGDAKRDEE